MFGNPIILEIAQVAITEAIRHGALYADVRVESHEREDLVVQNSRVKSANRCEEFGLGIRVVANGAWGFSAISEPNRHDAAVAARRAVEQAKAASIVQLETVQLVHESPHCAIYRTSIDRDPLAVPIEDKFELLFSLDSALSEASEIKLTKVSLQAHRVKKLFLNSEGSEISQELISTGLEFCAGASNGKEMQICSYACGPQTKGWSSFDKEDLVSAAKQTAKNAVEQLEAEESSSDCGTLILGGLALAGMLRDICSPSLELDRVLGAERNGEGVSFLHPEYLGAYNYGSENVNLYNDSQIDGGAGSFGYDDEGVEAQRVDLVSEGRFLGYMSNRESSRLIGLSRSTGSARAQNYRYLPLVRATNLCLSPGEAGGLEDLIADTKSGTLIDGMVSSSHDHHHRSFHQICETGWAIKDGKRHRRLKNPVYFGTSGDLWRQCNAICGEDAWQIYGGLTGGKGNPAQVIKIGNGCAPARFNKVRTGNMNTGLELVQKSDDSVFLSHPESDDLSAHRASIVVSEPLTPAPDTADEVEATAKPGASSSEES